MEDKSIIRKKKELLKAALLPTDHLYFYSQYNDILKQVAEKTAKFSIQSEENGEEFENRLLDAFEIIDGVKFAISFNGMNEEQGDTDYNEKIIKKQDHTIWSHGNVQGAVYEGYESEHANKIDKEWMNGQAVKYLNRPWVENELLEWIIVDSLMFGEVVSYGESIKQFSPKEQFNINKNYFVTKGNIEEMQKKAVKDYFKSLGNKFLWLFALPFLFAFWSYDSLSKEWTLIISVVYFCLLIAFFFIRGAYRFLSRKERKQEKAIQKKTELFNAMYGVYEILKEGTVSPKYFREKLYETSQKGAVWPAAIFMLVDHAAKRNSAIWNSPAALKYDT